MILWFLIFCALCSFLPDTSTPLLQAFLLKGIFSGTLHRALPHLPLHPERLSLLSSYKFSPAVRLPFHNIHLLQVFFSFTDPPLHIISKKKRSCLYPILVAQKENSTSGFPPHTWLTECYNLGGNFLQRKLTPTALIIISLYCTQALCKHSMLLCQHISVLA